MGPYPRFKYTGAVPGADSAIYLLYSTTGTTTVRSGVPGVAPPRGLMQLIGARKFLLEMKIDQAGTLISSTSDDEGVTWHQQSTEAIAVPVGATVLRVYDVGAAPDWKLTWTNGGSAQGATVWQVGMSVSGNLV